MRTKLVTILCLLLLAVTSLGFGVAFAAEAAGEGETAEPLTVISVGWGNNAEEFKKGFANAKETDRLEFQIWFSDVIDAGKPTNLLQADASIEKEVTKSALDYVEINGVTLRDRFDQILEVNGGTTDSDQLFCLHVQGNGDNLQFNLKKDNASVDDKYASLDACFFDLDDEGIPTADNFITVKKGFTAAGKTVAEDVTFAYNPYPEDGTPPDDRLGFWCEYAPVELGVTSITADDTKNNELAITVNFDTPVNKETVNNAARDNEGTVTLVNSQAKLDHIKANGLRESIRNNLVVGDKTIKQIIDTMEADKANIPNNDYDGQVDIHVKGGSDGNRIEIHIKTGYAGSVALEDGLTVAFLAGFRSDVANVSEDIVYTYNEAEGMWLEEGTVIARDELEVESVTAKDDTANNEIAITVNFKMPINKETVNHAARDSEATVSGANNADGQGQAKLDHIKANGLRESLRNNLMVGDKTIKQIIDTMKADESCKDYDGSVDVHIKGGSDGNFIEIHIKKGYAGSIALEDGLTVTFKAGFKSDLVTVTDDLIYTYIERDGVSGWYAEGEEPAEQEEVTVTGVTHKDGTTDIEISVTFDKPISTIKVNHIARDDEATVSQINGGAVLTAVKANGLRDSVRNKVKVGDKTIAELIAHTKAEPSQEDWASEVDVHIEGENDTFNRMRIVLKKVSELVDFSQNVTVTVMEGFHSDVAKVSGDITYTYDANAKFWLAPGEEAPSFDAVDVVGLDAPIMKDASSNFNTEFVVRFSEDIAAHQHAYISMPADFVGSFVGSKGDYSETELTQLNKYGVFDSMARNIYVNGKSVYEMMKVDENKYPLAVQPAIAVVHAAQGGNDVLRIVIGGVRSESGTDVPEDLPFRIQDLNQNFVITIKAGLRTPLGQEVKEDFSFIYDPVSKAWYEGDSVEDIPVFVTVTFMDGETVLNTMQCEKGGTVVAGIARKDGYTFEGWYIDAAMTTAWDDTQPVNENMTVYAKFTAVAGGNTGGDNTGGDTTGDSEGCGGCGSSVAGGALLAALGMTAVAAVLFKRRNVSK